LACLVLVHVLGGATVFFACRLLPVVHHFRSEFWTPFDAPTEFEDAYD